MYEVGIALACRHSSEILLIKDDHDKRLFDTSTIPHLRKLHGRQFRRQSNCRGNSEPHPRTGPPSRRKGSSECASLGYDEIQILEDWIKTEDSQTLLYAPMIVSWGSGDLPKRLAYQRLLEKGLITLAGGSSDFRLEMGYFAITPLGIATAKYAKRELGWCPVNKRRNLPVSQKLMNDRLNQVRRPNHAEPCARLRFT
jgi:hypothetical protein